MCFYSVSTLLLLCSIGLLKKSINILRDQIHFLVIAYLEYFEDLFTAGVDKGLLTNCAILQQFSRPLTGLNHLIPKEVGEEQCLDSGT